MKPMLPEILTRAHYVAPDDADECLMPMAQTFISNLFGSQATVPEYDEWFLESTLHSSGYVAETVGLLADKGWTYEKDGALWLNTTQLRLERLPLACGRFRGYDHVSLKEDSHSCSIQCCCCCVVAQESNGTVRYRGRR